MTNLKTVNVGQNKYCGPAVLSILTGRSTDDCAAVISRVNGQYNVTGVMTNDLIKAAERMGFATFPMDSSGTLYRTLTTLVNTDGMYIVTIPGHFVCIEVKEKKIYFCDNHTKEPIPAGSSARLGQQVISVYLVKRRPNYEEYKAPVIPTVVSSKVVVFVFEDPRFKELTISVQRQIQMSGDANKIETIAVFNVKNEEELKQITDALVRRTNAAAS